MSFLTQRGATGPLGFAQTSTDPSLVTMSGSKWDTSDGRVLALVQNAGTALAQGKLVQGPAKIANHQNLATSTQVVGDKTVTITSGGTLITANQYSGGLVIFNAGAGIGQTLKIASHPAGTASGTVVLTLEDPIQVATASGTTKSCLVLPAYGSPNGTDVRTSGVIICPANGSLTGPVIGVSISPIAASTATVGTYGFIQTKGLCAALNDGNTAIGLDLMPGSVSGSVATYVVATASRIGSSTQAGVDTEYRLINLQLN